MEGIKLDVKKRELSRKLLTTGYTKKVDCKNYWDSHGTKYWEADTSYPLERERKFEIVNVVTEWLFENSSPYITEDWELYIDGQRLSVGEIMGYQVLKTKLKLTCCIGSG